MKENKITIEKQIVKKMVREEQKTYTNYVLKIPINNKIYSVAITPKTFGRDWTHPMVRQSFTILDLVSEVKVIENE